MVAGRPCQGARVLQAKCAGRYKLKAALLLNIELQAKTGQRLEFQKLRFLTHTTMRRRHSRSRGKTSAIFPVIGLKRRWVWSAGSLSFCLTGI